MRGDAAVPFSEPSEPSRANAILGRNDEGGDVLTGSGVENTNRFGFVDGLTNGLFYENRTMQRVGWRDTENSPRSCRASPRTNRNPDDFFRTSSRSNPGPSSST